MYKMIILAKDRMCSRKINQYLGSFVDLREIGTEPEATPPGSPTGDKDTSTSETDGLHGVFEKVENIGQQNLPNEIKEIKEELKEHKENATELLRNLKGIWIGLIIVGVIVLLSNMRGIFKICHWCCT